MRLDRATLEEGLAKAGIPADHPALRLACRLWPGQDSRATQASTAYLAGRDEDGFFVSPFIDYSSRDGLFRKYRIAIIGGGRPYAVHMAIAEEWKVWYLNADMALSVPNRLEEATFMQFFDDRLSAPAMPAPWRRWRRGSGWTMC